MPVLNLSDSQTLALGSSAVKAAYIGSSLKHFNPKALSGLEAWWDAADSGSVTLDSGRVAAIADKSGNGRDATNSASGSTQPTYESDAHNGRAAIRFDAISQQKLEVQSSTAAFNFLHNGTSAYIAYVARVGDSSSPNNVYGLFGNNSMGATSPGTGIAYDDRSTVSISRRLRFFVNNASAQGVVVLGSNNTITFNTLDIFEASIDADNATAGDRIAYQINGGTLLSPNTAPNTASTANAASNFFLGAAGASGAYLVGDICEVMMYSQHPTTAHRSAIRQYLAAKWGVALV
jgi:hypothetical protein